jgi:hypothetical protein
MSDRPDSAACSETSRGIDAARSTAPSPVATRPLFSMRLTVDGLVSPGGPPGSGRRIGSIAGGTFEGDRLRGTVLPGGADWQTERGDGALLLDARIVLHTDDDALIAMTYTGIRHGPPEIMARLGRGEAIDPRSYYFRTTLTFATSYPRYDWLNRILAIGSGHRAADGPFYTVHEIV